MIPGGNCPRQPQRSGTVVSVEDYLDGEQDAQVRQDYRLVEVFRRSDNWEATHYKKEDEVSLLSVGIQVRIGPIYRRTDR